MNLLLSLFRQLQFVLSGLNLLQTLSPMKTTTVISRDTFKLLVFGRARSTASRVGTWVINLNLIWWVKRVRDEPLSAIYFRRDRLTRWLHAATGKKKYNIGRWAPNVAGVNVSQWVSFIILRVSNTITYKHVYTYI